MPPHPTTNLVVRVNRELKDRITQFAEDHDITASEVARLALVSFIWQEGGK